MKAIYPGSFNLFHAGHYSVYQKACKMFGKENVYLCVAKNPSKELNLNFILWTLKPITKNIISTDDLVARLNPDVIIRGLRDSSDINEELNLADWNKEFGADTIFIPCEGKLRHISSSSLRELYNKFDVDITNYLTQETLLSFHRWTQGNVPKRTLYCGKIGVGKSTFLSKVLSSKYGDCDKLFWNSFTPDEVVVTKNIVRSAIMSQDKKRYNDIIKTLASLRKINWENILSDKYEHYEASSLGQWVDYIPPHILSKFKIVELETSDKKRIERLKSRELMFDEVQCFDYFYKSPTCVDETIVI